MDNLRRGVPRQGVRCDVHLHVPYPVGAVNDEPAFNPSAAPDAQDDAIRRWLATLIDADGPFAAERTWRRGQLYSVTEEWSVRVGPRTHHIVLKRHLGAH